MAELPIRRSPSSLAIERYIAFLSLLTPAVAGGAIYLIHWSETLINDGPFPQNMKTRFLEPYGTRSFGILKLVMVFTFCSELARKFGGKRLVCKLVAAIDMFIRSIPAIQRATLYRGRWDWSISDPLYGTYGIIYCVFIIVCVYSAYDDTLVSYTRGRHYYAGAVDYEPCDWFGVSTPEFQACRDERRRLFCVQMLSLGFAIVAAVVHGLSFTVTAYKILTSFVWMMNNQLRIIRKAIARRPEIDEELHALEAQERLMAAGIKQEHDLEASFGSKVEAGFAEKRVEMDMLFERAAKQGGSIENIKKD